LSAYYGIMDKVKIEIIDKSSLR